jgi:hypothetical protein
VSAVFKKLQLKAQKEILVLNAPESFEGELEALDGIRILRDPDEAQQVEFALAFAITQEQLNRSIEAIATRAQGDALVWFAYPKASSKKYQCEFNRDSGWEALGQAGFEPVRQVAIDEDWSALRFRRVEYIKKMTRRKSSALTEQGKKKTEG